MADVKKNEAGAAEAGKKRHTGTTKKKAAQRVGSKGAWTPLDQPTPAKSAQAMIANGRSAVANGRKARAAPAENAAALKPIHALCMKYPTAFEERGMPKVVVQGAELVCEQLSVAVEVDALSPRSAPGSEWLAETAFVHKRRGGIARLHPGPSAESIAARAKFGLHEQVRPGQPHTLVAAAQGLLVGKKMLPDSRAAKLITAADEKRLRAIILAVPKATAEQRKVRAEAVSRTTHRDILNAALELFYDDFAATVGIVLEDDEVARVQALSLIPRRAEQRAEKDKEGGGEPGAGGAGASTSAVAPSQALVKMS